MTVHDTRDLLSCTDTVRITKLADEQSHSFADLVVHQLEDALLSVENENGLDRIFFCFGTASVSLVSTNLRVGECVLIPGSASAGSYTATGAFVMVTVSDHIRQQVGMGGASVSDSQIRGRSPCFTALAEAARRHSDNNLHQLQSYARSFAVLGLVELQALSARISEEPELPKWQLKAIDAYVERNLDRPIKINDLAELCDYSTAHFSRLFKARTGRTPHKYVLERRVDVACTELQAGENTISDVAYKTGFSSQSHMTSTFKQLIGMTPNELRVSAGTQTQDLACA
ncbi:AraC family transcriptional regulator [uncultured Roseobacter sp.]|uniref:helix-turn-helix transcriptional regulator n=1 Tax=uncultured Roseobacter sp. TaxID=114847 RepID=UPI00260CFD6F|nr:AraC family transcriptional regulator [uncultured Roseobacter sp.]